MAVKVAINGFGRIGRLAFRQMFGAEGYEVVAINDLTSPKMLAHLLKYDSSQGKYEKADTVSAGEDSITVDGKEIKIYAFPDANNCPWGDLDVDVVLECSGFYTSKEKAQAHINAGAKKVVISAPAGKDHQFALLDLQIHMAQLAFSFPAAFIGKGDVFQLNHKTPLLSKNRTVQAATSIKARSPASFQQNRMGR